MIPLTPKQRRLLAFIRFYLKANRGLSPTWAEMQEYMGAGYASQITQLVNQLEVRGAIVRDHAHHRSIQLVEHVVAEKATTAHLIGILQSRGFDVLKAA